MRNEKLIEMLDDDAELLEMLSEGEIIHEFEITPPKQPPTFPYPASLIVA